MRDWRYAPLRDAPPPVVQLSPLSIGELPDNLVAPALLGFAVGAAGFALVLAAAANLA